MRESVKEILMRRDDLNSEEADALIDECKEAIEEAMSEDCSLEDLEDLIQDYFGLEPDYLDEFLY
jgi:hypothetical protein